MLLTEYTRPAICHEAGHTVVAWHKGFFVERIAVSEQRPFTRMNLDDPQTADEDRFVVLAGGIAGEKFVFPNSNFDEEGARGDQCEISSRGGSKIDAYLPDALFIIRSNVNHFNELRKQLMLAFQESTFEFSDCFELLPREETEGAWRATLKRKL